MSGEYAICFDFPENDDPWFLAKVGGALGFTTSLAMATRFDSEEVADCYLSNGYGPAVRQYGAVVEVAT